jgi:hypothetical protein
MHTVPPTEARLYNLTSSTKVEGRAIEDLAEMKGGEGIERLDIPNRTVDRYNKIPKLSNSQAFLDSARCSSDRRLASIAMLSMGGTASPQDFGIIGRLFPLSLVRLTLSINASAGLRVCLCSEYG